RSALASSGLVADPGRPQGSATFHTHAGWPFDRIERCLKLANVPYPRGLAGAPRAGTAACRAGARPPRPRLTAARGGYRWPAVHPCRALFALLNEIGSYIL